MRRGHQASTISTREDPSSQEREGGERIEWVGVDVSEERVSVRVVANGQLKVKGGATKQS